MSEIFTDDREAPIRAYLTYYKDGELMSAWQNFPTTSEEMEYNLGRSGIEAEHLTGILDTKYETAIYALDYNLPRKPDLDELNELAHRLEGMDESARMCFGAMLEAGQCKDSLAAMINLTHNLDQVDFYPGAFTEQEFGGIMFETHASQQWEVRERLRMSAEPDEKAFIEYVERLEQCIDLVRYAPLAQAFDGGTLTQSGYLLPLADESQRKYTGPHDIPAEHRLTENQAERKPSLLGAIAATKEHQQQAGKDTPVTESIAPSGPEL